MALTRRDECEAAGLDPAQVRRIATGLSRYAKEAHQLGLTVFGGAGSGQLRFDDGGNGGLVVAELDGLFDGGDGASYEDDDGLLRGEY
ncbi:hypothetical protein [Aeromonas veronii]|uniref:hypothetical protein n=1 Tax=Aeromonas veronii TaxID=654 RepID=UPI00123B1540|nr:hypothetical protein [Aeromonas veronii]QET79830.1 hypothetical protein FOB40_11500 [Aeromonas veronii]